MLGLTGTIGLVPLRGGELQLLKDTRSLHGCCSLLSTPEGRERGAAHAPSLSAGDPSSRATLHTDSKRRVCGSRCPAHSCTVLIGES